MTRVVVTGASGCVGSALLRRLVARLDDHDVIGVARRPPGHGHPHDAVVWQALDVAGPHALLRLRHAFTGADTVVHLAWSPPAMLSIDYRYRVGIGGPTAVIEAAHAEGVGHLIYVSSAGVHARITVAVETQLDDYDRCRASMVTTRVRPAPLIEPDAVADALVRIIDGRHAGAFDLATNAPRRAVRRARSATAPPPINRQDHHCQEPDRDADRTALVVVILSRAFSTLILRYNHFRSLVGFVGHAGTSVGIVDRAAVPAASSRSDTRPRCC